MIINDPELANIVRNGTPVNIEGIPYTVHKSKGGSCDGCYFKDKERCPVKAVTYCTSNHGNILRIVDEKGNLL